MQISAHSLAYFCDNSSHWKLHFGVNFPNFGESRYISLADCKAGYWQLPVREEDKWLTAFVCDAGLFEFSRAPFGLKGSGYSFVRALSNILRPIREFTDSFVDDIAKY